MAEAVAVAGAGAVSPAVEEAKSLMATIAGQLLSIVRQIIQTVLSITQQIINYASEHPLAMTLLVSNIMIWVS